MSRESEVATRLRANAPLVALAPGGIYEDAKLGLEGITSSAYTAAVWAGGTFKTSVVVRQRAKVPQYRVFDEAEQLVDTVQVVEVYIYALTATAIEAVSDAIYALLQGHQFTDAYPATIQPGLPLMDAPNLQGVLMLRDDYQITSLRTPVSV